jgi:hypothetical protein
MLGQDSGHILVVCGGRGEEEKESTARERESESGHGVLDLNGFSRSVWGAFKLCACAVYTCCLCS